MWDERELPLEHSVMRVVRQCVILLQSPRNMLLHLVDDTLFLVRVHDRIVDIVLDGLRPHRRKPGSQIGNSDVGHGFQLQYPCFYMPSNFVAHLILWQIPKFDPI